MGLLDADGAENLQILRGYDITAALVLQPSEGRYLSCTLLEGARVIITIQ